MGNGPGPLLLGRISHQQSAEFRAVRRGDQTRSQERHLHRGGSARFAPSHRQKVLADLLQHIAR